MMLRLCGLFVMMMILTNPVHADLTTVEKTKLDEEIVDLLRRYGGKTAEELKLLVNKSVHPFINTNLVFIGTQSLQM